MIAFHCLKQSSEGGETLLTDGFKTALQLKEDHPEWFKLLTEYKYENTFRSQMDHGMVDFLYHGPVIRWGSSHHRMLRLQIK